MKFNGKIVIYNFKVLCMLCADFYFPESSKLSDDSSEPNNKACDFFFFPFSKGMSMLFHHQESAFREFSSYHVLKPCDLEKKIVISRTSQK